MSSHVLGRTFCYASALRRYFQLCLVAILLLGLSPAAEEKRLAVYTAQTSFTIPVSDHDGQEYVSLTDLVDPLGNATLTRKGNRWKLRVAAPGTTMEAEFADGDEVAKVRGKKMQLGRAFRSDGQRGYVPIESVALLMSAFTRQATDFRENSRRLFVGNVNTTYTEEITKGNPNKLVLHFSAPVNPTVSTEPGRVRLTFNREPVIPPGANPQSFDSQTIRSSSFSEANGEAEIAIATTASALATFSDNGRTITVTASAPAAQPAQAQSTGTGAAAPGAQPTQAAKAPQAAGAGTQVPAMPRFFVLVDAAHGGDDPGATLGNGLLEKDVTLAIARRIRADLEQRGITAVLLRDGDATLSLDQRAVNANASRASLYLCIHATTFGTGVHLYSARFSGGVKLANRVFLPWNSAQAAYLDPSRNFQATLVTELNARQIHSQPLESTLEPLQSIAKPALTIEVAEPAHLPADIQEGLSSVAYQQQISAAVGSAIADVRGSLEAR